MRILTLYFSRSGHTKAAAQLVQEGAGGDIARIRTRRSYASSYAGAVIQGGIEVWRGARPSLLPPAVCPEAYDILFLGAPVWWHTIAPAMKSFLDAYDLSGKRVYPFLTSGGSPGDSFQEMETSCRGARVGEGFHIYFKKDRMMADAEMIRHWARHCAEGGHG